MIVLRPYWRPFISLRPRQVDYDEFLGEISATSHKRSGKCSGWFTTVGGRLIALYITNSNNFILQIGKVHFVIDESFEIAISPKRFFRKILLRQGSKSITVIDVTRGDFPLSVSRFIGALSLDDWDVDDLLGDLHTWATNPKIIPRDLFIMRLLEENSKT